MSEADEAAALAAVAASVVVVAAQTNAACGPLRGPSRLAVSLACLSLGEPCWLGWPAWKPSTWIPTLARPELESGLSWARATGEGDRLMPRESGCHAYGLESAASAGWLAALSAGGQAAVPSPTPPMTSGWGPTAALVSKTQQLTELVAVLDPSRVWKGPKK